MQHYADISLLYLPGLIILLCTCLFGREPYRALSGIASSHAVNAGWWVICSPLNFGIFCIQICLASTIFEDFRWLLQPLINDISLTCSVGSDHRGTPERSKSFIGTVLPWVRPTYLPFQRVSAKLGVHTLNAAARSMTYPKLWNVKFAILLNTLSNESQILWLWISFRNEGCCWTRMMLDLMHCIRAF